MKIHEILQATSVSLGDVLWPGRCHICGSRPAHDSRWLCRHHLEHLPYSRFGSWDMNPMAQRLAGRVRFERASAFLIYQPGGMLAPLFHDFKYNGFSRLARYMGILAAMHFGTMPFFNHTDVLLPVPLHPLKRLRRGYNQAYEIAAGIGSVLDIPVGKGLRAVKPHPTQTGLTAAQRQLNTQDIFRYTPESRFIGKHIVIIDDVCTTGATLLSAARAVSNSDPSAKISFFTLAAVV